LPLFEMFAQNLRGAVRIGGFSAVSNRSNIVLWAVDTQADFMLPAGKLYVPGAEKLIPRINLLVDHARMGRALLISSGCQHAEDDPEFKVFAPHCLRGTPGAEFIPEALAEVVARVPNDPAFALPVGLLAHQQVLIEKQTIDVFKSHHASQIVSVLPHESEIFLFGVVTEFCVHCAGEGLLARGHRVSIVHDAIETLDPVAGRNAIAQLAARGAQLISSDQALGRLQSAREVR
jgi:nicotinamidase/pyrazinamidase